MTVKIDFQLNYQYGVIERIIFRLVLNGFSDAQEIYSALPIFSDTVIANGIKNLVNRQMIKADVENRMLSVSDAVFALIDICTNGAIEIDIPDSLESDIEKDGIFITSSHDDNVNRSIVQLKRSLLAELLPDINLDVLMPSLDFLMTENKGGAQVGES